MADNMDNGTTEQTEQGDVLKLYYSSVAGTAALRSHQKYIIDKLEVKKYTFEKIDISQDLTQRDKMRELMENEKGQVPQIFKGDKHIADYETFELAVEDGLLDDLLK